MKWIFLVFYRLAVPAFFYTMFFDIAPHVCTHLPETQWQLFFKMFEYFIAVYSGGIGLPVILICLGVFLIPKA
jgi:hypothetical protein